MTTADLQKKALEARSTDQGVWWEIALQLSRLADDAGAAAVESRDAAVSNLGPSKTNVAAVPASPAAQAAPAAAAPTEILVDKSVVDPPSTVVANPFGLKPVVVSPFPPAPKVAAPATEPVAAAAEVTK